ncbi:MAG: 30S ribosomal protein S21 [Candidatus Methylomirabilales bacterium]
MSEYRRRDDQGREAGGSPPQRRPLEVIVDDRGVESALRTLKRLVLRDGILRELKRKQNHEKPGERKRRKIREATRRRRRQLSRALRRKNERWE